MLQWVGSCPGGIPVRLASQWRWSSVPRTPPSALRTGPPSTHGRCRTHAAGPPAPRCPPRFPPCPVPPQQTTHTQHTRWLETHLCFKLIIEDLQIFPHSLLLHRLRNVHETMLHTPAAKHLPYIGDKRHLPYIGDDMLHAPAAKHLRSCQGWEGRVQGRGEFLKKEVQG